MYVEQMYQKNIHTQPSTVNLPTFNLFLLEPIPPRNALLDLLIGKIDNEWVKQPAGFNGLCSSPHYLCWPVANRLLYKQLAHFIHMVQLQYQCSATFSEWQNVQNNSTMDITRIPTHKQLTKYATTHINRSIGEL